MPLVNIIRYSISDTATRFKIMKSLLSALFPRNYREFTHKRLLIVLLRTVHIICFSILVGGFFFHQDKAQLAPWFIGVMLSGVGMFLVDMYGSCIILFEIRGISILIKLLLLSLIPYLNSNNQIILLLLIIVLSSYISHTTGKVRHRNVLPKRFLERYGLK